MVHDEARPKDFGALLVWYRRLLGKTQDELATAAQVSVRTISNIERGRTRGPQRRSAEALADTLELSEADRKLFLDAAQRGRRRAPRPGSPVRTNGSPWPASALCALPNLVADLTGRGSESAHLETLAMKAVTSPRPSVHTAVVSGFPGVGKTSLVTSVAHQVRDRFPDGQFFLDLCGTGDKPLSSCEALDRLLRAAGITEHDVPRSLVEKASVWRWLMRGRRCLVVLDDAENEAQVRPLLSGSDRGLTMITSRRVLAGLDVTHRIPVGTLEPQDSTALLTHLVGDQRVRNESKALGAVAELCEGLPAALRIAGNRLRTRPHSTVQHLVEQLSDRQRQLSTLTAGDIGIRSMFASSYRALDDEVRLVLRRLAFIPGQVLSTSSVVMATGLEREVCEKALAELEESSLLEPIGLAGKYRFSDLLKNFCYERLVLEDSVGEDGPPGVAERLVAL